jgi:hypothetical protein
MKIPKKIIDGTYQEFKEFVTKKGSINPLKILDLPESKDHYVFYWAHPIHSPLGSLLSIIPYGEPHHQHNHHECYCFHEKTSSDLSPNGEQTKDERIQPPGSPHPFPNFLDLTIYGVDMIL